MRRVAIIQARMGSTRLPQKILAELRGRPVLWHVIYRLRQCRTLDDVVVATPDSPENDALEMYCREMGIFCIRGPEESLLERFTIAQDATCADVIVRVTGDAPLVDPEMIDRLIAQMESEGADYACINPGLKTIHEGFSPFTAAALKKLNDEVSDDPVANEHVTAYFKSHPEFVKIAYLQVEKAHQFEGARISVDTPADLRFIETLYDELDSPPGDINITDVVALLRKKPELLNMNRHVHQKSAEEKTRRILIRCDGGQLLGMGHVVRCLALADALREDLGFGVAFVMGGDPLGMEMVHNAGFPLLTCHLPNQVRFIDRYLSEHPTDAIVIDVRDDLPPVALERWSDKGVLTVAIDDPSDRRLAANLTFYPPVPQVQAMSWKEARGECFTGWKWVLLRKQFAVQGERVLSRPPTVLIAMGGSDPGGMTLKAIDGVLLFDRPIQIVVVTGNGFVYRDELNARIAAHTNIVVQHAVDDMATLMRQADLAVAAFGCTAYELASQGVPSLLICRTPDHRLSASAFEKGGMARCLGLEQDVEPEIIHDAVANLLFDPDVMDRMSKRAAARIDGLGAKRIAAEIDKHLKLPQRVLGR